MATSIRHRGFKWTNGDASNPALALVLDETSKSLHVTIPTDAETDWNVAADSNPAVYVHSDTTPATDYLLVGRHTGTAADIDLVGAATLNLKIDGTAEALMTATIFDLASTDLQMQTGGQILDNNGNELVEFVIGNASAVNGVKIRNAATGVAPWITNEGGADIGLVLGNHDGTNWEEILTLVQTATAVNGLRIVNSATGTNPIITNEGEADTGITLANYDGTNTEELLILDAVATAVNELTISNAATGVAPKIAATGETNVGLTLDTKGTGALLISLGGVDALTFNDADSNFAGETDVAGHAIFVLAENGGTASADTTGAAGATITVTAGDGSAGGARTSNNPAGGAGGDIILNPGAGGVAGSGGSGAAGATGLIQFGTATCWTANSTASLSITALAPAGVGTSTISKWLTVKDNDGATFYIPAWT